jgi:hypothetical protein
MFLRDLYHRLVVGSWQTPESGTAQRAARYMPHSVRVRVGDPCPCGSGKVYVAHSNIHGDFLGCNQFKITGCRYAWKLDGSRIPRRDRYTWW